LSQSCQIGEETLQFDIVQMLNHLGGQQQIGLQRALGKHGRGRIELDIGHGRSKPRAADRQTLLGELQPHQSLARTGACRKDRAKGCDQITPPATDINNRALGRQVDMPAQERGDSRPRDRSKIL
jgi:hypothetical protein